MHHARPTALRGLRPVGLAVAGAVAIGAAAVASGGHAAADAHETFRHVGSFEVTDNLPAEVPLDTPTSAEIVDVTADGETLVYSDALLGQVGFVDISDPANPVAGGAISVEGGEPTSVAVVGDLVLVAVNTSADFVDVSGELRIYDLDGNPVAVRDLGGQPDSIAVSPAGTYAAVAIENERDEDLDDGLIPQLPAGFLRVFTLAGTPDAWPVADVDLTGLADTAPSDPEPEYVHVNGLDQAVVSLQENNHIVVVDLVTATVVNDFSAGSVAVSGVDGTEEELGPQESGLIELTDDIGERRREPDSVVWVDDTHVATANEGDYEDENGDEGGSRSFTIFDATTGAVVWEAGTSFEYEVVAAGHFPEGRAENKGVEPEGLAIAEFGGRNLLFVGAERANVVGVYDVTNPAAPDFVQLLPTGIGPEGIAAIPGRDLVAVTAEVDGADDGFAVRPIVTLFELAEGPPAYPYVRSGADAAGLPIPWVALSGLTADPDDPDTLYAVSDSFLAQSWIYEIDVSSQPAIITDRIPVGVPDGAFDLEGIAARPGGGFWLASEGRNGARPNAIVRVDEDGTIIGSPVELPAGLAMSATNSGFEGVAVTYEKRKEIVWVVVQREWADDPAGLVKVGRYEVAKDRWTFAHYPLDAVESPNGGWVGLSEITVLPGGEVAIVERDNQIGPQARIKRIYEVDLDATKFKKWDQKLRVLDKSLLADVVDELDDASISVPDKLEGTAITADGRFFAVTDNDGVDENFGETILIRLDL